MKTQQNQEEAVETQHHPTFHLTRVQSSEMSRDSVISAILTDTVCDIIKFDVHKQLLYQTVQYFIVSTDILCTQTEKL